LSVEIDFISLANETRNQQNFSNESMSPLSPLSQGAKTWHLGFYLGDGKGKGAAGYDARIGTVPVEAQKETPLEWRGESWL
jgi:hypothetical protein